MSSLTGLGFGTVVVQPVAEARLGVVIVGRGGHRFLGTHTALASATQAYGSPGTLTLTLLHVAGDVAVWRVVVGIVFLHHTCMTSHWL